MVLPRSKIPLNGHWFGKITGASVVLATTTTCVVLGAKQVNDPTGVKVTVNDPTPEDEKSKTSPVRNGLPDHTPLTPPCTLPRDAEPSPIQEVTIGFGKAIGPAFEMTTSTVTGKAHCVPEGVNVIE